MSSLNSEFKKRDTRILSYWKENKIFEKSLEKNRDQKSFVFFEGPPTANGKPGIHHFFARALKDLYGRYKTMQGFYVLRKAGWDTHGLPVELEVEKRLGFKSKKEIEEYGIEAFNKKAKESVWEYKSEWEKFTNEMGYWLDMSDPYVTYDNNFIESGWSVLKKAWDRDLVYKAHKVIPFCTRCGTGLSSHEVAQGYKTVEDTSVYIKFKIKNSEIKDIVGSYILAWTTTPWTLPGNVALAVGENIEYVVAIVDGERLIVAKERLKALGDNHSIEKEFKGSDLVGSEYEPLFDVSKLKSDKSYRVYTADFVSTEDGTGVVHTAVMYGEDDYNLGTKLGLPKHHTVDLAGKFVGVDPNLDGKFVKNNAVEEYIVESLKSRNLLFKSELYSHEYPYCWRCDTPLLYYAKDSWFIRMSELRNKLISNNNSVNWYPDHVKEGRFGQWLKDIKDWAITRERYWGTPFPVFYCSVCDKHHAIGSVEELEERRYRKGNNYILLRHGHSEKNGHSGNPEIISSKIKDDKYHLREDGVKSINELAKELKGKDIDLIISSPFIRTKETAEIISKELGIGFELDDRITEYDHGSVCEGRTHHVCGLIHESQKWNEKSEDGETWREAKARVSQFLLDLESKYEGKNILIISHGDPIWLMETFAHNRTEGEASRIRGNDLPKEGEARYITIKNYPYDRDGNLDLHKPYIDSIEIKCPHCSGPIRRLPDVMDVWFDSGVMPYAQWHYPFENKEMIDSSMMGLKPAKQFPADFIVEGQDQTRGWFYTLLAVSTILDLGAPYKNVMATNMLLDDKGKKMSKSKGNVVNPFDVMEAYGADASRWYFYTVNDIGESKLFSMAEVELRLKSFVMMVGNCLRFYELYSSEIDKEEEIKIPKDLTLLDRWILSKLSGLISYASDRLDNYDILNASRSIEKFISDDFSNWWLRRSRKRKDSLPMLRHMLVEISKLISPFTPFLAEDMYLRLKSSTMPESVHLESWPKADTGLIDEDLEKDMAQARDVVTQGLGERKNNGLKVRQPLRNITVNLKGLSSDLEELICDELNIKGIEYNPSQESLVLLNTNLDQDLINEGLARDLARQIQEMRKEAGFGVEERVLGQWRSESSLVLEVVGKWADKISEDTLVELVSSEDITGNVIEKDIELTDGEFIRIGLKSK